METGPGGRPSRDEAHRLLRQLGEDESAVRYPPLPSWFFPLMATIVAGLALVQLLEPADSSKATLALGCAALLPASRYWLNRDGVAWTSVKLTDMVPFLLGILGTFAAGWAISELTDAWWIWCVCAVTAAGIVLWTGRRYRREFGG